MVRNAITFRGIQRLYGSHREDRQLVLEELLNDFLALRGRYPAPKDADHPLNRMSQEDYLRLVDSEADEEDDDDEDFVTVHPNSLTNNAARTLRPTAMQASR